MSTGEILMILFIYLLLFGAKGVPSIARTLGKTMYQFRNAAKDVQDEILKSADDMRKQARAEVPLDQLMNEEEPAPIRPAPPVAPPVQEETKTIPADDVQSGGTV
ncbi:MAG: twin-arginine translocase TatA/TatE family subunit [Flavobacteriales bacterium]|jgi:TatA/E family protein of Tat protein translocase|nr:twin-arginine translocase TatA/TatE family subunit [Flavobacteriales bacterium]MDP4717347.1 twin-arginine translocase TatA/TatE family subunit [Flavobacteriales bacterium]MDP4731049.1 twin-arginine translocase TatA/TatE family subunit [Flavobacteriales bacterium]MDP4818631.1 twin-arginine translocase TatA/TatE family subunit [Flavobacteriales bacterium]MDP4951883.1 twin-arginine translocase TatA/TatE family subunit [Flavobacteriales bacterium]